MNTDVEFHIRQNYPWTKLPANVKQVPCFNVMGEGDRGTPVGEPVNVTAVLSLIQTAASAGASLMT